MDATSPPPHRGAKAAETAARIESKVDALAEAFEGHLGDGHTHT
jgi:hypothetical protein